jgi:hypothetical protein
MTVQETSDQLPGRKGAAKPLSPVFIFLQMIPVGLVLLTAVISPLLIGEYVSPKWGLGAEAAVFVLLLIFGLKMPMSSWTRFFWLLCLALVALMCYIEFETALGKSDSGPVKIFPVCLGHQFYRAGECMCPPGNAFQQSLGQCVPTSSAGH